MAYRLLSIYPTRIEVMGGKIIYSLTRYINRDVIVTVNDNIYRIQFSGLVVNRLYNGFNRFIRFIFIRFIISEQANEWQY